MRQIKFRAWIQSEKCFIGHRETIERAHLQFAGNLGGIDDVIMQYTGLKDKNGEEIYEGDIIQRDDIVTEVRFINGSFDLVMPSGIEDGIFIWKDPVRAILDIHINKIIGNIYENPELLNSKK